IPAHKIYVSAYGSLTAAVRRCAVSDRAYKGRAGASAACSKRNSRQQLVEPALLLAFDRRFLRFGGGRRRRQFGGEALEKLAGQLLRRGVDQPSAELRQLAADLRVDGIVEP